MSLRTMRVRAPRRVKGMRQSVVRSRCGQNAMPLLGCMKTVNRGFYLSDSSGHGWQKCSPKSTVAQKHWRPQHSLQFERLLKNSKASSI